FAALLRVDVQFPGPVAALAANRLAAKDRQPVTIDRVRHRFNLVAVAEEARWLGRPLELLAHLEPWRQVPSPGLRIPADERLEQIAIAIDQIGAPAPPGANCELDLGVEYGDGTPLRVVANLTVENAPVPP